VYLGEHFEQLTQMNSQSQTKIIFSFRDYNWFWIFLVGPHVGAILGVCIFHLILKKSQAANGELVSSITISSIDSRQWQHFNTHLPKAEQQAHYQFPGESHKSRDYSMKTL